MKRKKPSFRKLEKLLEEIQRDPKLRKEAKRFVANLGSKA